MKYLHAMIRVKDVEASLHFYTELLDLKLIRENHYPEYEFSLYYLATAEGEPEIELTKNHDDRDYSNGDNFGHLAFRVDNVYETCQKLMDGGVDILCPPIDGYMAFVKDPSGVSIELLQEGDALPAAEPWASMPKTGSW
ncbi:MAG: VOC family protein [Pseudomonadota bacterium]